MSSRKKKTTKRSKGASQKWVKTQIMKGKELKAHDVSASLGVGIVATITALSDVPGGTAINQRIGNKINLISYNHKMNFTAASGDGHNFLRYIIFLWNEDIEPLATNILASPTITYSLNNVTAPFKYTVLEDRTIELVETASNDIVATKSYRRLRSNPTMSYNSANGDSGTKNRLFMLSVSDSVIAPNPVQNFYFRMRYIDS